MHWQVEPGSVIAAVDGHAVTESGDLRVLITSNSPGDSITLTIVRNGEQISLPVVLGGTTG